ncbi:MAG: hypothetical protein MUF79_14320 [Burkholderiales bacterium]|jgi:hypothetical protein|nr:hypothetical protein [Burkholderiales bacterium]
MNDDELHNAIVDRRDYWRERAFKAERELAEARETNHVDLVLPPFGHAFTLPCGRLDMDALE